MLVTDYSKTMTSSVVQYGIDPSRQAPEFPDWMYSGAGCHSLNNRRAGPNSRAELMYFTVY